MKLKVITELCLPAYKNVIVNSRWNTFSKQLTFFVIICCLSTTSQAYYEARPVIRMSEVLTSQQAQSVYHRVVDIELDGKFYNFHVDSDMGQYKISSLALFRNRIQEITTLAQAMSQFNKDGDGLSRELGGQFSIRADSALDIISRPVQSAANLAGQFADNLNETLTSETTETQSNYIYLQRESKDSVAAMHKRNIANQWGLDVYSSNLNVQEFLNTVTLARSAGRISAGTPTLRSQIRRPVKAADVMIEANTAFLLKNKSVSELQEINRTLLTEMHINVDVVDHFLLQMAFSPTHKTRITHYLASIEGVRNRSAFIEAARLAKDEVMALSFDESAMMVKHYHDEIVGLEKLFAGSEVLEAISKDNRIVYFVPIDLIYWSESTERLFNDLQSRAKQSGFAIWELVTAGAVTEEAHKQLAIRKFVVRDKFVNK